MDIIRFANITYDIKQNMDINLLKYDSLDEYLNAIIEKGSTEFLIGCFEHANSSIAFKKQIEVELQKRSAKNILCK